MSGFESNYAFSNLFNVAAGKSARQSSTSPWSLENDAAGVLGNDTERDFGFHTDFEDSPWWEVDLGDLYPIAQIRVLNRRSGFTERANTLSVHISTDGVDWRLVHGGIAHFGSGPDAPPLVLFLAGQHWARYVRLQLNETQAFHLSKVEVLIDGSLSQIAKLRTSFNWSIPIPGQPGSPEGDGYRVVASSGDGDSELIGLDITNNGAFGNSVIQYINAIQIAKRRGLKYIRLGQGGLAGLDASVELHGITFIPQTHPLPDEGLFLRGYFFVRDFFQRDLQAGSIEGSKAIVHKCVRPLYPGIKFPAERLRPDDELALHIRSGDIFSTWVHPEYIQPPLSFYELVIERLRRYQGVQRVKLVFEDRLNPVIDELERRLISKGVPTTCQSGTVYEDVSSLLAARHTAYGIGTFGPAVCLFSEDIDSVHYFSRYPTFGGIEGIKNLYRIYDKKGDYIQPGDWKNTLDQRKLMVEYPVDNLELVVE